MTNKKILLLGDTGKMGIALKDVFENGYSIIGKNTNDFDAIKFEEVGKLIEESRPDIVINAVAFTGIDACEKDSEKAFCLNTLYPKFLAEFSNTKKFLLVHFSTDAVFNDKKKDFYVEGDYPVPINIYGFTKYGGDCFIQNIAESYYIFRTSILFGMAVKNTQFVEKLLQKIKEGHNVLKIADDIIASPTYSKDVAREIRRILESNYEFGLYHIVNKGKASLYDLMQQIIKNLKLDVVLERVSYKDFPFLGRKNTYTPLKSEKLAHLRSWKESVGEYCSKIKWIGK